ncbi:MAG: hypothetical protein L3J95_04615 [Thermoplasmata archaeon]|nr:hypothetical protein [Thermoplasmata archaeon]MCI4359689.1 hypothetical protein [Thermoplasmata archaeon]
MGAPPPPSPLVPPPRAWQLERPPPPRLNPWPLMIALGRVLGIILIFVGTLIAVVGASVPGSCAPPGTCAGFFTQAANSIIFGKVLWVLGLFCLAGASGLRLQGNLLPGTSSGSDMSEAKAPRVGANLWILLLSIVLMAVILLTINSLPSALTFGF